MARTLATSDTDASCLDLEAQATFVLPQSRSNSRFHAGRGVLAGGIESIVSGDASLTSNAGQRKDGLVTRQITRHRWSGGRGHAIGVPILTIWRRGTIGVGLARLQ